MHPQGCKKFNKTGSVKSNNGQLETEYEYIDALPLVGVAMYRIRSVDMDGQYTFSKVVSVSESNNTAGLQVLNNPAHKAIYITASDAYKSKYLLNIKNEEHRFAKRIVVK